MRVDGTRKTLCEVTRLPGVRHRGRVQLGARLGEVDDEAVGGDGMCSEARWQSVRPA